MSAEPCIFVVDDDDAVRETLQRLLESTGRRVRCYASAEAFLNEYNSDMPGCLVLDVRMPGLSGLDLQMRLINARANVPIIFISGHGEIESAVRSIRLGALDFIRKPYSPEVLLERIDEALSRDERARRTAEDRQRALQARALLTPRELEVVRMLSAGRSAKEIAHALGLSRKTVDVHRRNVHAKLGTDSVLALARVVQHWDAHASARENQE